MLLGLCALVGAGAAIPIAGADDDTIDVYTAQTVEIYEGDTVESESGSGDDTTTDETTTQTGTDNTTEENGDRKPPKKRRKLPKFLFGTFSTYVPGTVWEGADWTWFSTGAKGRAVRIKRNKKWRWHGKRGRWRRTGASDYPIVLLNALDGHDWKVGSTKGSTCSGKIILWDGLTWYCGKRVKPKRR